MSKKVLFLTANAGVERDELAKPLAFLKQQGFSCIHAAEKADAVQTVKADKEPAEKVQPDIAIADAKVQDFDLVVLPGGTVNADTLRINEQALNLLQQFAKAGKTIAAICHAPWLLVNAELAKDKKLTSYKSIRLDLQNAGAHWVDEAVVQCNGNGFLLITSRCPDDIPAFNQAILQQLKD